MASSESCLSAPRNLPRLSRMGRPTALWLQALLMTTFMAASSAPTPLYSIYRESWRFSAATLTIIFAVYAVSLLLALLMLGSVSDHIGRRPVIVGALVLDAVSMLLFLVATSIPMLIAARLVQGVATGAATSALAAGLMDLDHKRSPVINSVAPMVGLAVGALGASILVQFAPEPMRLVYAVLLVVLVALALATCFMPETAGGRPGVWAALRPAVTVPAGAWRTLLLIAPMNVAVWALGGYYLSLGPTLVARVTGIHAPVIGGLMVFAVAMPAAISVLLLRAWAPRRMLVMGALSLMLGVAVTLEGVHAGAMSWFFVGTGLSGIGFGLGFLGAMRTLLPVAKPHERAGLMAVFYIMSYLAFCLPAISAGVLTNVIGLIPASNYYGLVLIVLGVAALAGDRLFPGQPVAEMVN